ncbi:SH3 domain-containing protein [Oricola sp.]|uniref:SH3 domain-containing protein n=1 Tax=Oricola sp. TaxID=1979950 RepID=UPI003BA9E427
MKKTLVTLMAAAAVTLSVASGAGASAFTAWSVTDVPWGDTLNVRKYPASYSQKQNAYPNDAVLSMTGRCKGGLSLFDIAHLPDWQQRQIVRYKWCEIWHSPAQNGQYVSGWVYMKYMRPL